jgi:hypothetical protein
VAILHRFPRTPSGAACYDSVARDADDDHCPPFPLPSPLCSRLFSERALLLSVTPRTSTLTWCVFNIISSTMGLWCFFLFLAAASLRCVYSHLFHGTIAYHWVTLSHPIAPPLPPPSFKSLPLTHVHRPSFSPGATPPRSAVFFFGRAPSSPECHDTGLTCFPIIFYSQLYAPFTFALFPTVTPKAPSPRLHLSNLSVRRRRRGSALVPCDSLVAGSFSPLPPISGQHHWLFPRHF